VHPRVLDSAVLALTWVREHSSGGLTSLAPQHAQRCDILDGRAFPHLGEHGHGWQPGAWLLK
jgi:hypothetical protein